MKTNNNPICPDCGRQMRLWGRGATLRKHGPSYICPRAEYEEDVSKMARREGHKVDENGMVGGALHKYARIWRPEQLS